MKQQGKIKGIQIIAKEISYPFKKRVLSKRF